MRRLLTTTTTLLATAALLLGAPAANARASTDIEIKPGTLPRGADISGPHLDGTTIVDGDIHVTLKAPRARLYGKWHDFYIAATTNLSGGNPRLLRVTASGKVKVLREGIAPDDTILDSEAGQVAYSLGDSASRPTIAIYDLGLKKEISARAFSSLPDLLEYDEGLVVASFASFKIKTIAWDTVANLVTTVNAKQSNYASKAHDLLGYFNKDPFFGGCQVLAHLSDPGDVIWTNCDERIEAVSPDGKRVATIALLSDGLGPRDVVLRRLGGAELAHYSINGWFGRIWWETPTKLLLESNGKTRAATVRCKVATCDRATDLSPTPDV